MKFPQEFENKTEELIKLCQKYNVLKLFVFGSLVNNRFKSLESDIDLIAEIEHMPPQERGEAILRFWDELEQLFARKVDLITNLNFKNPYFKAEIEKTKVLVYDGAS